MRSREEQEAALRSYYDASVSKEDARLDEYPFEFAVTRRYIERYLAPGARVLDAACGTGRYTQALLAAGYHVGAGDLSGANVAATSARLACGNHEDRLAFVRQGNALNASSYAGGPWDGILLLGPCYHLPQREDRIAVLRQAAAHLGPGGRLYVSFVTRLAVLWWAIEHRPEAIDEADSVHILVTRGIDHNLAPPGQGLPSIYFCDPGELEALFADAGLAVSHVCGTEGPFGGRVALFHAMQPAHREKWLDFTTLTCETPLSVWSSEHLLVVARKE